MYIITKRYSKIQGILIISFVYALIFFLITSEAGLAEDPSTYYDKYSMHNIDLPKAVEGIHAILSTEEIRTSSLSFSEFNIAAFVYFGILSLFPFKIFVFLNMYLLSIGAFTLISKLSNISLGKMFLVLLTFPMIVNLHFTWRQFAAQIVVLFIINSSYRYKKVLFLICAILIHPSALISATEKHIIFPHWKFLQRCFLITTFGLVGYIIAIYSTVSFLTVSDNSVHFYRNVLWVLLLILYLLPLILKNGRNLSNTNLIIFIPMLLTYLVFSDSPVGISRIVALGIFSTIISSLSFSSRYANYYAVIGPITFVSYILFLR